MPWYYSLVRLSCQNTDGKMRYGYKTHLVENYNMSYQMVRISYVITSIILYSCFDTSWSFCIIKKYFDLFYFSIS